MTNIPDEITQPSRTRRTKVMITLENKQILDYIIKGATHEQIMKWVGLSEKNYWKQIWTLRYSPPSSVSRTRLHNLSL